MNTQKNGNQNPGFVTYTAIYFARLHTPIAPAKAVFDFQSNQARGYKTFFMLNSAEHEICPANKSQMTQNCKNFLAKHS